MHIPIKNKSQIKVKDKGILFVDNEDFKLKLKTLNNLIVYNSEEIILEIPGDPENVVYNHLLSFSNGSANGSKGYGIYYLKTETTNQKIYSRLDDKFSLTFNIPISNTNLPILRNENDEEINYLSGGEIENDGYFSSDSDLTLSNTNNSCLELWSESSPETRNFIFASSNSMNTYEVPSLPIIIKIKNSEHDEVNDIFMACGDDGSGDYTYCYTNKDGSVYINIICDGWLDTGEYCTFVEIRKPGVEESLYSIVPNRNRFIEDGDPDPTIDDLNNASESEYFIGSPGLVFSKYE